MNFTPDISHKHFRNQSGSFQSGAPVPTAKTDASTALTGITARLSRTVREWGGVAQETDLCKISVLKSNSILLLLLRLIIIMTLLNQLY